MKVKDLMKGLDRVNIVVTPPRWSHVDGDIYMKMLNYDIALPEHTHEFQNIFGVIVEPDGCVMAFARKKIDYEILS
jgi:hypothetical protein